MNNIGNDSHIARFFCGRSIFITGATGFMGKVLVEKLLRSCPGIKNIYILLRGKNGLNAKQRLDELINGKIFDRIKNDNPKILSKVIAISGDITFPGLGINESDLNTLTKDVSVAFHIAATVKFDEPLKVSVGFNVLGTRHVIELCHKLVNLSALIHVSTAYANCNRYEIDEVLYPAPVKPQQLIDAVEWMSEDLINEITPKLINDRPNTYTYTKALAENLLVEECGSLPVAIVRPSIVTAAFKEPFEGWVDNIYGPTGLALATGKGLLRTMLYKPNAVADLIPVDMVINLMITVAWYTATQRLNTINVYNCTSGLLNPLPWGHVEKYAFPLLIDYPSNEVLRYPGGSFKSSKLLNNLCIFYDHYIPAYIMDTLCSITGRKQIMVKLYGKLHKAIQTLEYFTTHHWRFKCNNVIMLSEQLQGIDKQVFDFNVRQINWADYWNDYVLGIRKYILKEDPATIPQARRKLQRIHYLNNLIKLLALIGFWHLLIGRRTRIAKRIWLFFTSLSMRLYHFLQV